MMTPRILRAPGAFRAALIAVFLVGSGCSAGDPLAGAGLEVSAPPGWQPFRPGPATVAGEPLYAVRGPLATAIIYRTLPVPKGTARGLAAELSRRLENLPDLEILRVGTTRVGGMEAARVEVAAPGDGYSLAPSGMGRPALPDGRSLTRTHRISLGLPRRADTIWFVWHYAEDEQVRTRVEAEIEAMIRSISVRDPAQPTSSY